MTFNARFLIRWICATALVFEVSANAQSDRPPAKPSAELIANGNVRETYVAFADGRASFTNNLPAWSLIRLGDAAGDIARDSADPPQPGLLSLRLTVRNPGQGCGVVNESDSGFKVVAGEWYDLTFSARTATNVHFALTVSIESRDGKKVCARATIPEVGGEWKSYMLPLNARQSDSQARLVITMADPGTIWLTQMSLLPRKTEH